jgi:hypothetical protein
MGGKLMHLRKGKWFRDVVAELKLRGFTPGGAAVPRLVSSYRRERVTVEIRGGNTLRIVHHDGSAHLHQSCDFARAVQIIAQLSVA